MCANKFSSFNSRHVGFIFVLFCFTSILLDTKGATVPSEDVFAGIQNMPIRAAQDYGMIFWHDGLRGTDEKGRRLLCIQTGFYGVEFDVEKAALTRLGSVQNALDYESATRAFNEVIETVPEADSSLTIMVDGKTYRCVRGADPWEVYNQPAAYWVIDQEPGRKVLSTATTPNKQTNLRLIEYGQYRQVFEIDRLRFEDEQGTPLNARTRLIVESWPDVLCLRLEIVPDQPFASASAGISVDAGSKSCTVSSGDPADWAAGARQSVAMVIPFASAEDVQSGGTVVEVTDQLTGEQLPVRYDASLDVWKVLLANHSYPRSELNHLDRYSLRMVNSTDQERVFRILFANEMGYHERDLPYDQQGLKGCSGTMGAQLVLRDEEGNPLGLPVQNAHNWPTLSNTRAATPDLQPWLDLDQETYGSWLHYAAIGRLPAGTAWNGRADVSHALWGGVPQASYYFLSLIGWGYYTFWDVAIQGSWGESICYSIGGYADSDVTDMRPLYVPSYDSTRTIPFEWTPNQGGANFLDYKVNGEKQYLMTRRHLPVPGPCLTRTGFNGLTEDRKIRFSITAEHPRTDDLNRTYYRLHYEVLQDMVFDRLSFFQFGNTAYNFFEPKAVAWGDGSGLNQEIENPPLGILDYFHQGLSFEGAAPWWVSMHRSDQGEGRGDQEELGLASRGLVIRSWDAVLGGARVEKPHLSFFGTHHRFPGLLAEISPPPGLVELKAGDYVDMQLEVFLVPKIAESYLGTNQALKESLLSTADTWQAVYRQAKGNELKLKVTVKHGDLKRGGPVEIQAASDGTAEFEITGGLAYVPVTFTDVPFNNPVLYSVIDGVETEVDQSDHGKDFWQTERDPVSGLYRITYNLNLDAEDDVPATRTFRFEQRPPELNALSTESDFCGRLEPCGRILELDGWTVWGCSPIYGEDGKVHVFYSRWRGSFNNWIATCEVGHAVADRPEGPYEHADVALAGRGGDAWDSWSIHNPTVQKVGDRYVIFYMASNGSGLGISKEDLDGMSWEEYKPYFRKLVASKQIGMAISDSLYGPWERVDEPLLGPSAAPAWDDLMATNPSLLQMPDGTFRLYYKSMDEQGWKDYHGNRKYGVAMADRLEGPYVKYEGNPIISFAEEDRSKHLGGRKPKKKNTEMEDAYVWHENGVFRMIMRDMGVFNDEYGLFLESADGLDWSSPPEVAFRESSFYFDEELPGLPREGRLERPQLLMKDGHPEYLFCAWRGGKYKTASGGVLKLCN